MKSILFILVVAGAGMLGYFAEPSLRAKLTGSLPNRPKASAVPQTEAVPEVPVQLEPEPSPAPSPIPPQDVAPAAEAAPEATPAESVPETPAQLEPEPTPTPIEPALSPAPADVVQVMQASIDAGQIKEFTKAQVVSWTTSTDEIADGETYQIGLAAYKAETIFGIKTIQAKAMIQSGKVVRWIWPKSGMEIK
jgi:hypothetical protein